jgi:ribosomal protein S18 acetylase RimI-like enzyme
MEFREAHSSDLAEVMALFHAATLAMDARQVFQWDGVYPCAEIVQEDIDRVQMQVGLVEGKIAVVFALEPCQEGDYETANWRYPATEFVVLHRLCVHPDFQGQGIAKLAMDYLEQEVRNRGIHAIRLDAFPQNPVAIRLYESRGYEKAGEITYRKGLFHLYEKKL